MDRPLSHVLLDTMKRELTFSRLNAFGGSSSQRFLRSALEMLHQATFSVEEASQVHDRLVLIFSNHPETVLFVEVNRTRKKLLGEVSPDEQANADSN